MHFHWFLPHHLLLQSIRDDSSALVRASPPAWVFCVPLRLFLWLTSEPIWVLWPALEYWRVFSLISLVIDTHLDLFVEAWPSPIRNAGALNIWQWCTKYRETLVYGESDLDIHQTCPKGVITHGFLSSVPDLSLIDCSVQRIALTAVSLTRFLKILRWSVHPNTYLDGRGYVTVAFRGGWGGDGEGVLRSYPSYHREGYALTVMLDLDYLIKVKTLVYAYIFQWLFRLLTYLY